MQRYGRTVGNHRVAIILSLGLISGLMNRLIIVNRRDYRTLLTTGFSLRDDNTNNTNNSSGSRNRLTSATAAAAAAANTTGPNETNISDTNNDTLNATGLESYPFVSEEKDDGVVEGGDDSEDFPTTFRWEYIDFERPPMCGADKCLFRSSRSDTDLHDTNDVNSGATETETEGCPSGTSGGSGYETGYLVSKDRKHDASIGDGWKIARYLASRFGIEHFFLGPPIETTLDRATAAALFLRDEDGENTSPGGLVGEGFGVFRADDSITAVTTTVQKIRIAPAASRELRLKHTPERIVSRLEELLRDGITDEEDAAAATNSTTTTTAANNTTTATTTAAAAAEGRFSDTGRANITGGNNNSFSSTGADDPFPRRTPPATTVCGTPLPRFLDTLEAEVTRTLDLLRCEPLLALDFQVMVDAAGNLYHLDFDRVLSQLGGLRRYNQSRFDDKIRTKLAGASGVLGVVLRWIDGHRSGYLKQQQQQQQEERGGIQQRRSLRPDPPSHAGPRRKPQHTTAVAAGVPGKPGYLTCRDDWEDEEAEILTSSSLPCLATERVAVARGGTTSTMTHHNNNNNNTDDGGARRPEDRRRHPLLVALLRRVIDAGYYGTDADVEARGRDCDAYGDRVVAARGDRRS